MATLEERVAALEEKVRIADDERAIVRTLYQYSQALDYEVTPDLFADCFTEDAVWWSSVEGKSGGTKGGLRLEGRQALATWFMASGRGTPAWLEKRRNTKHSVANSKIRVDGDTATAESYLLAVFESMDGPYIHAIARYTDKLVRCPDGRWRFKERHLGRESASVDAQERRVG